MEKHKPTAPRTGTGHKSRRNVTPSPQGAASSAPTPRVVPNGEELGEGNRTAAKRYNEGLKHTMQSKDIEALAEDAKRALEGPEGAELREAEQRSKRGPESEPGSSPARSGTKGPPRS